MSGRDQELTGAETAAPDRSVPPGTGDRFAELVRVMDRLRSPGGCEWDRAQTHASLLRYLVEETYEVVEAVESPGSAHARDDLVEELGDILLQVVFHARIGQEHASAERFDITDVIAAVTDKLVRRHPLVFGAEHVAAQEPAGRGTREHGRDVAPPVHDAAGGGVGPARQASVPEASTEELSARWDAVKRAEKPGRTAVFDGIPPALPALAYAEKALSKARRHGVEPSSVDSREAADSVERAEAEWGERMLDEVRAATTRGLDPERALRGAVRRYITRNDRPIQSGPSGDR